MRVPGAVQLLPRALLLGLLPARQAQTGPWEGSELSGDMPREEEITFSSTIAPKIIDTALQRTNSTSVSNGESQLEFLLMLLVPLTLLAFLLLSLIIFIKCYKRKGAKQDELGSENLKVPIFEEDTPSVMEIEMEELDKWMGTMHEDCGCLPPLKEEKEPNLSPSDH